MRTARIGTLSAAYTNPKEEIVYCCRTCNAILLAENEMRTHIKEHSHFDYSLFTAQGEAAMNKSLSQNY
jgi:hypothetical protein